MRYLHLHEWDVAISQAAEIQRELRQQLVFTDEFSKIDSIAGVDVGVPAGSKEGHAAVVVLSFPDFKVIEARSAVCHLTFPYVPGYLSFREIPVVLRAFEQVEHSPDIIMVDGQGFAHPRGLGIASHLGLLLDTPTIGCAKSRLCGTYEEPAQERGSISSLIDRQGNRIGDVVRTKTGIKPVFVSPGNKISFDSATRIVLECAIKYRLPEPTRLAHQFAAQL